LRAVPPLALSCCTVPARPVWKSLINRRLAPASEPRLRRITGPLVAVPPGSVARLYAAAPRGQAVCCVLRSPDGLRVGCGGRPNRNARGRRRGQLAALRARL